MEAYSKIIQDTGIVAHASTTVLTNTNAVISKTGVQITNRSTTQPIYFNITAPYVEQIVIFASETISLPIIYQTATIENKHVSDDITYRVLVVGE